MTYLQMTNDNSIDSSVLRAVTRQRRLRFPMLLLLAITLAVTASTLAACRGTSTSRGRLSTAERDAVIRQAADEFVRNGDLSKSQAILAKLQLANPTQFVVTFAEQAIADRKPTDEIAALARLADALGGRSPKLVAYLAPTITPSPLPKPTDTIVPPSPTVPPTATSLPPTATPIPPTVEPTATATLPPQQPRVVADSAANLRGGPGTNYPVIGQMTVGKEVDILERNASGDWWRIDWNGVAQAWVAGLVVKVSGPIDTVPVAKNVPAPPPTNTPAPPPPPTATPKPAGPDFQLVEVRVWGVQENGGYYDGPSVHCGEKRELHIKVVDAGGAPLNGVTVKAALGAQEEVVTGSKGVPGDAEFVLGGGQEVYIIRDVDGRQVTSDMARGVSTNPHNIPFAVLIGGGYCRDEAGCASFVNQYGCYGHYSWTVTFRRNR
jgi:hypothetical protein